MHAHPCADESYPHVALDNILWRGFLITLAASKFVLSSRRYSTPTGGHRQSGWKSCQIIMRVVVGNEVDHLGLNALEVDYAGAQKRSSFWFWVEEIAVVAGMAVMLMFVMLVLFLAYQH